MIKRTGNVTKSILKSLNILIAWRLATIKLVHYVIISTLYLLKYYGKLKLNLKYNNNNNEDLFYMGGKFQKCGRNLMKFY